MICSKCNKKVPDDSEFCPYCGNSINGKVNKSGKTNKIKETMREHKLLIIPGIVLALIIVGSISIVFINYYNAMEYKNRNDFKKVDVLSEINDLDINEYNNDYIVVDARNMNTINPETGTVKFEEIKINKNDIVNIINVVKDDIKNIQNQYLQETDIYEFEITVGFDTKQNKGVYYKYRILFYDVKDMDSSIFATRYNSNLVVEKILDVDGLTMNEIKLADDSTIENMNNFLKENDSDDYTIFISKIYNSNLYENLLNELIINANKKTDKTVKDLGEEIKMYEWNELGPEDRNNLSTAEWQERYQYILYDNRNRELVNIPGQKRTTNFYTYLEINEHSYQQNKLSFNGLLKDMYHEEKSIVYLDNNYKVINQEVLSNRTITMEEYEQLKEEYIKYIDQNKSYRNNLN